MFDHLPSRQALALMLSLALAGPALALETPRSSRLDHRVRTVNYNAADVIQLDAVIGVATHIVLAPDERYVYHVFGDSQAYAFTYKDNHLFFKPTAEDANTNLIVVTDQRDYSFRLSYSDSRSAPALYKLVIRYPDAEARKRDQAAQQAAIGRTRVQGAGEPALGDFIHGWRSGRHGRGDIVGAAWFCGWRRCFWLGCWGWALDLGGCQAVGDAALVRFQACGTGLLRIAAPGLHQYARSDCKGHEDGQPQKGPGSARGTAAGVAQVQGFALQRRAL